MSTTARLKNLRESDKRKSYGLSLQIGAEQTYNSWVNVYNTEQDNQWSIRLRWAPSTRFATIQLLFQMFAAIGLLTIIKTWSYNNNKLPFHNVFKKCQGHQHTHSRAEHCQCTRQFCWTNIKKDQDMTAKCD